ncbi:MAG: lysophospholipid acyltransferase family protein [Terrimicrobiaceae bacterium]
MFHGVQFESTDPLGKERGEPGRREGFTPALVGPYLRQLLALGLFFGLSILYNFAAGLLTFLRLAPRDPAHWQHRILRHFLVWRKLASSLGVVVFDFPEEDKLRSLRGTIVAANHPSLVDAFVLLSALPHAVCIMRSDLLANPAFSNFSRLAGYIANDRGKALVHAGIDRLARGENLVIFPEGTRSRQGILNPFKRGFALMATRTGTPVQTIIVHHEGEYLTKNFHLFRPSQLPVRLSLRLGKVFTPEGGESANDFARRLEAYFRDEVTQSGKGTSSDGRSPQP